MKNLASFKKKFVVLIFALILSHQSILNSECSMPLSEQSSDKLPSNAVFNERQKLESEIKSLRAQLQEIHKTALSTFENCQDQQHLKESAVQARNLKRSLWKVEERWRQLAPGPGEENESAPWHFPQITLFQFLNEIASQEHLYLLSSDLAEQKVSLLGGFGVPRQTWSELVDWILAEQGLGQRTLSPLCRQIYRLSDQPLSLDVLTDKKSDLELITPQIRLCLVLPLDQEPIAFSACLEKFSLGSRVEIRSISGQVALIGCCGDVKALLSICSLTARSAAQSTYRVIALRGIGFEDFQKAMDDRYFQRSSVGKKNASQKTSEVELSSSTLRLIPLANSPHPSMLAIGLPRDVDRALALAEDIEAQMKDQVDYQLLWYQCKNEKPEVLAQLAQQLAEMLIKGGKGENKPLSFPLLEQEIRPKKTLKVEKNPSLESLIGTAHGNCRIAFDVKSGCLVMSLPRQIAQEMEKALARFDRPKKMVRIDFTLLERKITDCNRSGLQLLKLGSLASGTSAKGAGYGIDAGGGGSGNRGILEFALSQGKGRYLPAYDLAYNFLLSQENVQINANPSILTINGVPAKLNLVEETSINTGSGKIDKTSRTLQSVYQRANYGIKISITPHIQFCDDQNFIALEADLTFDTRKASSDDRPDVSTRFIQTTVRVADGQSLILGGLKQKDSENSREKIPFLGDLPGIGKLFGSSLLIDKTTEMFLFITPKIVDESSDMPALPSFPRIDESELLREKIQTAQKNKTNERKVEKS